ncbi:MAG: hypothetical protein AAGK17_14470, partial [Pseudomonadota bacterium]
MADTFQMPSERDFGWTLKTIESTDFQIHERENGQFCAVLGHSMVRGVTSEMIHWWFRNFGNLNVILEDVPGYEGQSVPAYLLWHPSDHCSARFSGKLAADGTAQAGGKIAIQEAMQYKTFGLKYPVNTALDIFYCAHDGWAMGKALPIFGKAMCLRISFKDVVENGRITGVHYHYEVVIGVNGNNVIARALIEKSPPNILRSSFPPSRPYPERIANQIDYRAVRRARAGNFRMCPPRSCCADARRKRTPENIRR